MPIKIDLKDKKILFELDKNSRISISDLARKVRLSKEVVFHRLNKLVENKIILKFHTVSASYRFGLVAYKVYLKLQDISVEEYNELQKYLLQKNDVFWIGNSKGKWDLMFGVWATNIEQFFKVHDEILEKYSKYIQEKELSIGRKTLQYNRRWIYSDNTHPQEFDFGENESMINLDKDDKKILDMLVSNSRIKIVDIASQTKLSTDVVAYRIKKMEKEKIIRGYKCLFNAKELGYVTCKSFIFFKNITEEKKKTFLEYFKQIPQSVNAVITFAPWDAELMFEVDNFEHFYDIMEDIKEKFKEIIKYYESALITSEPKQSFMPEVY